MFPYWLLFTTFAIGGVFYQLRPQQERLTSPLFIAAIIATTLMIGFRYQVGTDWINYSAIYEAVAARGAKSVFSMNDPAYMAINAFSSDVGADLWLTNLLCGAMFMAGLAGFARRQPNPWLAIAVAVPYLVIVVAMGYTRQAAAIGILMGAIGSFEDRRYLRFLVLIAVATAIHKSAVLVMPLIALSTVRQRFVVYSVAAGLGALTVTFFLDRFLQSFGKTYLEAEMTSGGATVRVLMNAIPASAFLLFQRRFIINEQDRLLWRNFAFASLVAVALLTVVSSTAVDRIALYLIPLQVVVLSRAPYAFGRADGTRNDQLLLAVLVYSVAIQSIWLIFSPYARFWVPYRVWPF